MNTDAPMESAVDEAENDNAEKNEKFLEHYQEILNQNEKVRELGNDYRRAAEDAKAAKSLYNSAQETLQSLINDGPENRPLFDKMEGDDESSEWQDAPIGDLFLGSEVTASIQEIIIDEVGITSVGEFEDLRAGNNKDYPRGLIDIKGIGEGAITKLENASLDFLASFNQPEQDEDGDDGDDEFKQEVGDALQESTGQ